MAVCSSDQTPASGSPLGVYTFTFTFNCAALISAVKSLCILDSTTEVKLSPLQETLRRMLGVTSLRFPAEGFLHTLASS